MHVEGLVYTHIYILKISAKLEEAPAPEQCRIMF